MATAPQNGAPIPKKAKSGVKRENKPRTFYMAYKGDLQGDPKFVFDKDELVDAMLDDRELKVKRIVVPVNKRATQVAAAPTPVPSA